MTRDSDVVDSGLIPHESFIIKNNVSQTISKIYDTELNQQERVDSLPLSQNGDQKSMLLSLSVNRLVFPIPGVQGGGTTERRTFIINRYAAQKASHVI